MKWRVAASAAVLCLRGWAQPPACTIRGTVVDAATNRPVVRARVIAEVRESHAFLRLTDARGGFCFERLDPAAYHLRAQKAGYGEELHGVTLTVEEDTELKPLALRMTAFAGISGVVQDSGGDPSPGAEVTVWKRVRNGSDWGPDHVDEVKADRRGGFRFSELAAGTYYLSVKPADRDEQRYNFTLLDSKGQAPREKEVEIFYSGSFTFAAATAVDLKAGQKLDSLVLTLRTTPLRRVSGRIAKPSRSTWLSFEETGEVWGSRASGDMQIGEDGNFSQEGLRPARYKLRLGEGNRLIGRTIVDLTNGDGVGVTVQPVDSIDVSMTFRTEGKGAAYRPIVGSLLVDRGSEEHLGGRAVADGTCRFEGVPRGVYELFLNLNEQNLYIKKISYGGEAQQGHNVDLREGPPAVIEVTLSANLAEVHGRIAAPPGRTDGDADEDVTVILVDTRNNGGEVRIAAQAGIDQEGRFQIQPVPPGKYQLLAIEGFDEDAWGSPELLKALSGKSVELELKESEKKQVTTVTVISSGEWEAALKKSGG